MNLTWFVYYPPNLQLDSKLEQILKSITQPILAVPIYLLNNEDDGIGVISVIASLDNPVCIVRVLKSGSKT